MLYMMLALVLGAPVSASTADVQRQDAKEVAREFAECAGFWRAYAEFVQDLQPSTAEQTANIGNGASIAASYFASSFAASPAVWVKRYEESEQIRWRSFLSDQLVTVEEVEMRTADCAAIAPVQKEIIDELRDREAGVE
ncbi:MAG: hypothetical protein AAF950_18350 [Pseudomonadota bacterium]